MGTYRDSAWYDRYFEKRTNPKFEPRRLATWPLYEFVVDWVVAQGLPVVDVGCGPGVLYVALRDAGFVRSYKGVDFSPKAIGFAIRRADGDKNAEFLVDSIERPGFAFRLKQKRSFVICETLEHLQDDLAFLDKIPQGNSILFSVPNFDAPAHVRKFDSKFDAFDRYIGKINELYVREILISIKGVEVPRYYVGTGVKR